MAVRTRKVTRAQRQWLEKYERDTGFEPMRQDELDGTALKFYEIARDNVQWFERWASDTYLFISSNIPGADDWIDAELRARPTPAAQESGDA